MINDTKGEDKEEIYLTYPMSNKLIKIIPDNAPLDLGPCGMNYANKTQVVEALKKSILNSITSIEFDDFPVYKLRKIDKKIKKIIRS